MKPLQIVFPSRADPESPVIDLDLHLPLLCFRPEKVLQVCAPPDLGQCVGWLSGHLTCHLEGDSRAHVFQNIPECSGMFHHALGIAAFWLQADIQDSARH